MRHRLVHAQLPCYPRTGCRSLLRASAGLVPAFATDGTAAQLPPGPASRGATGPAATSLATAAAAIPCASRAAALAAVPSTTAACSATAVATSATTLTATTVAPAQRAAAAAAVSHTAALVAAQWQP